jgi:hypothetical protein
LLDVDVGAEWKKEEERKQRYYIPLIYMFFVNFLPRKIQITDSLVFAFSMEVTPFYKSTNSNWSEFLHAVAKVGTVLFAGHVGSQCYNLNVPGSDVDILF